MHSVAPDPLCLWHAEGEKTPTVKKMPAIPTRWERGLGRLLACRQSRSFATAFLIRVNQVFKHTISKLNMKYNNIRQREYREQSGAPDITDVSLCNWIKTEPACWIRVYITVRNRNPKKVKLTPCVTETGRAFYERTTEKTVSLYSVYRWSAARWICLCIHGYSVREPLELPEIFPVQLWFCTELIIFFFLCSVILGQLPGLKRSFIFFKPNPSIKIKIYKKRTWNKQAASL